jgi:hypothetical protein
VEIDQNIVLAQDLSKKDQWVFEDYGKGVILLSNIKEKDPKGFANYLKTEGSSLFTRLTDYRRYDSLLAGKNMDEQFQVLAPLSTTLARLVRICYSTETKKGKLVLGKEIISSMIASMTLNGRTLSLIDIKFPDKEALDAVRKQGWEKVQSGTFAMIQGALITIGNDSRLYEKEDLLRLAAFLPNAIKEAGSALAPGSRDLIAAELEKINTGSSSPEIKKALSGQ